MLPRAINLLGRWQAVGWLFTIPLLLTPLYWLADRAPPFEILSVDPASARPGEMLRISMTVRRDIKRNCSAEFNRYVYSSAGYRRDMDGMQFSNADQIIASDKAAPGRLYVSLLVPSAMEPGTATLVTAIRYNCNPMQAIWPIQVTTRAKFVVLPASGAASSAAVMSASPAASGIQASSLTVTVTPNKP